MRDPDDAYIAGVLVKVAAAVAVLLGVAAVFLVWQ